MVGLVGSILGHNVTITSDIAVFLARYFFEHLIESNVHLNFTFGLGVFNDKFLQYRVGVTFKNLLCFHDLGLGILCSHFYNNGTS